ncbi:MAG: ABC transporter substrate-binding protein [Chloroflexi bacterium]|nr:MAG: ABC transporter substrate-binding protein [Chloroflexota bacterium]
MLKKIISPLILVFLLSFGVAAQDDVIEITFVHIFGEVENTEEITDVRIAVIQEIIDAYMAEHPNVVITARSMSTDYVELFDAALAAATQGNPPHIVQVEEGLTQLAADTQLFVPLNELATEEQLASLSDLLPQIREYYTIGEEVWGIPWNVSNPLLYYNRDLFVAAGLDPDSPPTTFDEVLQACEALMAADLGLNTCMTWPMVTWFPEQWVAMQGGLIANNDNGRAARATEVYYNSPEMLYVLEWWQEMKERGFYSYSGSRHNYAGELIPFGTKRAAMTINSSGGLSNIMDLTDGPPFQMDLGVAPLFRPNADSNNGVTVGGASIWLMGGHPQEEQLVALDFMFYLTNTENIVRWAQGSGYLPTRTSSVEQLYDTGWFDENPFFEIALNQLLESEVNIATAGAILGPSAEVRGYLLDAFQAVIDGGEEPEAALAIAKERADAELADYNSLVE